MTALKNAVIFAVIAAAVGVGLYQTHQVSALRTQLQTLRQLQEASAEDIRQLAQARDEANRNLTLPIDNSERLNQAAVEIQRLRDELSRLRGLPADPQKAADMPRGRDILESIASEAPANIAAGRELGLAVIRGDSGAFEKILELSKALRTSFRTNSSGLIDSRRGELARLTFAPLTAAFEIIAEAAATGNPQALDAVLLSARIPELKGQAIRSIGTLAAGGNDAALETLLNPHDHGFLLSSVVGALRPSAESGNQKAIDALAVVASDANHQALWYMAADGLSKAAEAGNAVAIDALIGLSTSTNRSVRNAVVRGLQGAAANQNARAIEALRSLGM